MIVTLYRCPKCKEGHYDDDGMSGDYANRCYLCGYVGANEPVRFAPVPSAETRSKVISALRLLADGYSVSPSGLSSGHELSELRECWREGA